METPPAMASAPPSMGVEEELKCPICIEYLTDPVSVDCGHNFCRGCVTQYCEAWEDHGPLQCPLCKVRIKGGNFRPNWQLANIVEKIKLLPFNPGKEDLCGRHKENLNLFCKEDEKLMCVICERSPEHRSHTVVLLEEAAEGYKSPFRRSLESLKKEREKTLANQTDTEKESKDLLATLKAERKTIVAEFRQLRQFLEEKENRLLAHLEELEEKIIRGRDGHLAKIFQELCSLDSLIWQVEEKCRQPPSELLKDVRGTLQRCEKRKTFEDLVSFPPVLNWSNSEICDTSLRIKGVIKEFKDNLLSQLHSQKDTVYTSHLQPQPLASMEVGNRYQGLASCSSNKAAGNPPIMASVVMKEKFECPICLVVLTGGETLEDLGAVECPVCRVRIKVTDAESKEVPQAASPNKATQPPPTVASAPPVTDVEEEAKCPICKELFTDPVTLNCGHNFCRDCITQYCEKWEDLGKLECPVCRIGIKDRKFQRNYRLANIVENVQRAKKRLCVKHKKELNLFCKDDDVLLCVACWKSPEHNLHTMLLIEEAAQEYKENIQEQLQSLEKKREELEERKESEVQRIQECLKQLEKQKLKITSVFKEMHKFLEQKERVWLTQLADQEKEIRERQEENMTRLSEEISCFRDLIKDVKEKCQQPPCEFLQDIRRTWDRCQEGQVRQRLKLLPGQQWCCKSASLKITALQKAMEELEGSLMQAPSKVSVTLDPDTANPWLVLSEDLKSVRFGTAKQNLPDNPERFGSLFCVLGCERFTSGRHWWEVEVETKKEGSWWLLGVAQESRTRKRSDPINPDKGIWAVGKNLSQPDLFLAFTSRGRAPLPVSRQPRRIWVFLDYAEGRVEFFDADTDNLIFTFPPALFSGEGIRPFFWVGQGVSLQC